MKPIKAGTGTQGKYTEVGPLLKRTLAICEKALGTDQPEVATSLNTTWPVSTAPAGPAGRSGKSGHSEIELIQIAFLRIP